MIRSHTARSSFSGRNSRISQPSCSGGPCHEPPTTAIPPGRSKSLAIDANVSGRMVARDTIAGNFEPRFRMSSVKNATFSRPRTREARLAKSILFCARSTNNTSTSGHRIASGMPGRPTPEPRSTSVAGVDENGAANSRESPMCLSSSNAASPGPTPPAGMASWRSQSRYDLSRSIWGDWRVYPARPAISSQRGCFT